MEPEISTEKTYVTLGKAGIAELTERKSVFIGYAKPVRTEAEAHEYIKEISNANGGASHNVYAYLFDWGRIARYSDAGEPRGTAGLPVLEIIRKNNFTDAVIVVTRYFGGILLGAGGLIRAYSAAAKAAVDDAGIVTYVYFTEFKFFCGYSEYQKIQNELPVFGVITDDAVFEETVTLKLAVKENKYADLIKKINELCSGRVKFEITGGRYDKK